MLKSLPPRVNGRRAARRRRRRPAPVAGRAAPAPGTEAIALVQSRSLPMLVQQELERMILAGDLPAGSKLNEAAIAERLGVSRGPVREAFRALEESGLVRLEKNRGVFVRQIGVEEADEIYELRAVLDEFVGRRARADRIAPSIVRELRGASSGWKRPRRKATSTPISPPTSSSTTGWSSSPATPSCSSTYRRLVNELHLFRARDARAGRRAAGVDARASRDRRPRSRPASRPPPAARCTST